MITSFGVSLEQQQKSCIYCKIKEETREKKILFMLGRRGGRGDEGDCDKSLNLSGRMLEYKLV